MKRPIRLRLKDSELASQLMETLNYVDAVITSIGLSFSRPLSEEEESEAVHFLYKYNTVRKNILKLYRAVLKQCVKHSCKAVLRKRAKTPNH